MSRRAPPPPPERSGLSGKVLLAAGGGVAAVLGLIAGGVAWSKKRTADATVADALRGAAVAGGVRTGAPPGPGGPDTTVADVNAGLNTANTAIKTAGAVADVVSALA